MRIKTRNQRQIKIREARKEEPGEFNYYGTISKDEMIDKEISSKICLAAAVFIALDKVQSSSTYKMQTKINIHKSNIHSVLLYGSQTWKTSAKYESNLREFKSLCLRRILI